MPDRLATSATETLKQNRPRNGTELSPEHNGFPSATNVDRLADIRARLEWWETPALGKVVSVKATKQLIDDIAALLDEYDAAGLASDRAQVIRAALERWEDNPPQVGRPFTWDSLFALVGGANWLLGAVDAVRNA